MSNRAEARVSDLVLEEPSRARVFEQLGIDYCCGGRKPLARACAELDE
jgi:regulator of cell morphogenesis and NO signaling